MLERLSGLVLRRRKGVLVVALLLVLAGGAASSTLFAKLSAGGFENGEAESARAAAALRDTFGQANPNLTLLVTAPRGVDTPGAQAAGMALAGRLAGEAGVTRVTSYWTAGHPAQLRSADRTKALVLATIAGDDTAVEKRVTDLLPAYQGTFRGLRVQVGGYATLQHEMIAQGQKDAEKGEGIVFPVTLVLLVFIFGSVVAAALPLVVAIVTVLLCIGFMWVLAGVTTLSSLAVSVVTLLGLGLAIDYSLLVVNRYREELRARREVAGAVRATMRTAGRTVVFSAITVAVALAGLAWFPLDAVRSMAYAGVATALLAAATSVTVLPALLVVLGPRVERWRLFRRGALSAAHAAHAARDAGDGFWHRLAIFVMRRPLPIATAVVAVLLLLGVPALGLNLGMPDERIMPASSSSRQVATAIEQGFDTSEQSALQVVVPDAAGGRRAVAGYAAGLSRLPDVARVDTVTGSYARGGLSAPAGPQSARFAAGSAVYLSVVPTPAGARDADGFVGEVRGAPAPFRTLVGGVAAVDHDATTSLLSRLPVALGSVALVMLVLLFLVTGSVLVPLLSLVLSALSLTATFGALVWVFQDGHLSWLLGGFTVTGNIAATVPAMLFALSFGLAMDYQVFLLSRIREEYEQARDGTVAVAMGLERIGRIVTAAAVLISIVFLAFTVSGITLSKAYGIGLPLAVLMDATLIRGALLPATMRLCGRATWWAPGPLRRLYARAGLDEAGARAPERLRATTTI
jgi:RND superfamily putative drug exporter